MDHSETSRTGTGSAPLQPGRETTLDLSKVFDATVLAMAGLAEPGEGGNHIVRMQHFVRALAHKLKASPVYGRPMSDVAIALLYRAVPLHDIGNSSIPDRILLKPGSLDEDEIRVMRTHTRNGCAVIDQIKAGAGLSTQFLEVARDIVACHHEHWDGRGYPEGLVGDAIPVMARITALADTYDALTSDRVYRPGVPHDRAVQLMFQERAAQFDPDMVDALIEIQDEFAAIAERFSDTDHDFQKKMDYMAMAIAETP